MYNPGRGWVYMCVAGSGGGTRYARLPPVIEIIPLIGVSHTRYTPKKASLHRGIGLCPQPSAIHIAVQKTKITIALIVYQIYCSSLRYGLRPNILQ